MTESLAGKWVWIWNWRRCEGADPKKIAARLRDSGCRGALVKAYDGPYWFDQGWPWREIARALKAEGLSAGGWGYHYGNDTAGEARRAIETAGYGEADLLVLDVESEFEGRPDAAEALCGELRRDLGVAFPLYFSSFAIARYHRSFPYEAFRRHSAGAAPQVYWNAFGWATGHSLGLTYEDYVALGIRPPDIFPVAGLYREGDVAYPDEASVLEFGKDAFRRGSKGVSFWSYEHMDETMWQAVARVQPLEATDGLPREVGALDERVSDLEIRVGLLEARGNGGKGSPPLRQARTYDVAPGDSLSSIAAALGLPDWRALYEANRQTIGPDPNLIYPGQTLVIP